MATAQSTSRNPSWWDDSHTSGWERAKEALRRDWDQTKADLSDGGQELNQDVADTLKQVIGKQAIPPAGVPNRDSSPSDVSDWNRVEPAVRYGYGARLYYTDTHWSDDLENKMRSDWAATESEGSWEQVKAAVKRGWHNAKNVVL